MAAVRLLVLLLALVPGACAGGTLGGAADDDAGPRTLDGYLIYREPMILPPDAQAQVRLVRLSTGGTVDDIVAVSEVEGPLMPPVPFQLLYDPAYLRAGEGATALEASIELYGRILFSSEGPLPVVLPPPSPEDVLLVPVYGQWNVIEVSG